VNQTAQPEVSDRGSAPAEPWRRLLTQPGFVGYIALHVSCLAVIWVGWSPVAVGVAVLLYLVRMFVITGFFHRYFSHRTFQTSRPAQLLFAFLGATAAQRGPIWWAAHHRHHHRYSDQTQDLHSPLQHGLWWSHVGWIWSVRSRSPDLTFVRDLTRFPELERLDRWHALAPLSLALATYALGEALAGLRPELGTSGPQMLIWGFSISTVVLYHATYTINSLAHRYGARRYDTNDGSRNNALLALITLGEGWHNNHHRYPASTRQGFYWWEIDITYHGLRVLERLRLIRDIREVPARIKEEGRASAIAG
jgi:stearoyl-CoA desaturase (delta-9 desaturase)